MYGEARNRYTALEDLQDSAKKFIAALTATQRTHADTTRLLPLPQTPTETPRRSLKEIT
jgi:plasmid replication initiation protein